MYFGSFTGARLKEKKEERNEREKNKQLLLHQTLNVINLALILANVFFNCITLFFIFLVRIRSSYIYFFPQL